MTNGRGHPCALASDRTVISVESVRIDSVGPKQEISLSYPHLDAGTVLVQAAELRMTVDSVLAGSPVARAWIGTGYVSPDLLGRRAIVRARETGGRLVLAGGPQLLAEDEASASQQIAAAAQELIDYPKGTPCPNDSLGSRYDVIMGNFSDPLAPDGGP